MIDFPALRDVAEQLRVQAQETDQKAVVPREHLEKMAATGLFRARLTDATFADYYESIEILSAACGVSQFVHAQHQGSISVIAASQQQPSLLEDFMAGRQFCGVAFAHLRRPGPPAVTVTPDGDDYIFHGQAPWFSGWGLMDWVLAAGTLPDGRFLYATIPTAQLTAGEPMRISAMQASSTVTLTFDQLRVPGHRQVQICTAEEMSGTDLASSVKHSAQALGVVRAAAPLMDSDLADHFLDQARLLRDQAVAWRDGPSGLRIRARANLLGVHAAQAAVVCGRGGSNSLSHPAQRLVREAMFYCLPQLTSDLRKAHLDMLREVDVPDL